MSHEYFEMRRICYPDPKNEDGTAQFVPVCEKCSRFVKANAVIRFNWHGLVDEPNAVCSRCGPTKMLFEGFF